MSEMRSEMNRGILSDTVRIGAFTACVKLSGALKTVIVARSFGAGDAVDAYLMAFLVPSFAGDVLAGAIAPSLLPILVEVKERQGSARARDLASAVLASTTALLLLVALLVALLSSPALHFFASGFPLAKVRVTQTLLFWMLPILPLSAVTATFRTVLNAEEHFAVPALAPAATPVAIVAAIYMFGGTRALAAGTLAGALLEITLLASALWRVGLMVSPHSYMPSEAQRVFREYAPVAASYLILGGSSIVDQSLAATLGSGSVSALNYGTRLVAVIVSIGSSSLGTAILPRFPNLRLRADGGSCAALFAPCRGARWLLQLP